MTISAAIRGREDAGPRPGQLVLEHVDFLYGGARALSDVSLKVDAGSVVALLGSNGAGKTTTA
jgi:branched-chain amino acid transport system ATP-binding protein